MSPSTSATIALPGSGNPGRLQAISHMDGVPQVNRRLSLWTKRSRPSLRLVLKVVDLLPHGGHPQQKDDCPLRWIVDMVLWTAPFDSRYPMASVFFLVLFQSRFLNNDLTCDLLVGPKIQLGGFFMKVKEDDLRRELLQIQRWHIFFPFHRWQYLAFILTSPGIKGSDTLFQRGNISAI